MFNVMFGIMVFVVLVLFFKVEEIFENWSNSSQILEYSNFSFLLITFFLNLLL